MTTSRKPGTRPTERQTAVARWLWLLFSAFIIWGSLIPFNFVRDRTAVAANIAAMSMNPLLAPGGGRRVSIPDAVQNMLLFAPFGMLGVAALARWRRSPAVAVVAASALTMAFSALTEGLQLFTVDRIASTSDVLFNSLGGVAGATAAGVVLSASRRARQDWWAIPLMDEPAFYPMAVAFALLCAAAWQPFDVTLEAGVVWHKLKALRADVWQMHGVSDEGLAFLRAALFSSAVAIWLDRLHVRAARATGAVIGVAVAGALELSQFFLETRMPGAADLVVHVLGAVAGAAIGAPLAGLLPAPAIVAVVSIATWVGGAWQGSRPSAWMPFLRASGGPSIQAGHVIELALMYMPLGFSLPLAWRKPAVHWFGGVLGAAMAASLQLWPHASGGQFPDVPALAVAVCGCLSGVWLGSAGFAIFDRWISSVQVRQLLQQQTRGRGQAPGALDRAPR